MRNLLEVFWCRTMSDDSSSNDSEMLPIQSCFVRGKNVLYAEADFSLLFVDYFLHLKDNAIELSAEHSERLKTALALFSLHCISRPRGETLAWTINFQEPLLNLFVGGDTDTGAVVGRIYTENVKAADEGAFYQDSVRRGREPHRSVVGFKGGDMIGAVEEFYKFSEQRPARFFELGEDRFAILAAHPDFDEEWFQKVDTTGMKTLEQDEEIGVLETRGVKWHCGCNQKRILDTLLPVYRQNPEELFLNEELIEVNCPRCAGKHRISREMLEAAASEG